MINSKRVHCVGVGGIGLSAIAKFLKLHGISVSGSEKQVFEIVEDVRKLDIPVAIGFSPTNIPQGTDLLVYSDAFREGNVEVDAARAHGIKTVSYAEMLGMVTRNTTLFAVTGTNGKSTTTAMLGKVLEAAGIDPTVLVGTKVPGFQYGNLRNGDPDTWVVEADDYREHFLELAPSHAIVNNIELDHLDYFKDYAAVERGFSRFVEMVQPGGTLILNADNPGSLALKKQYPNAKTFGIQHLADADFRAVDIHVDTASNIPCMVFSVQSGDMMLGQIQLRVPGEMNIANAMGVIAMALSYGIAFPVIQKALHEFTGVWRRFEIIGVEPVLISDYAHHPTAIIPTIQAARAFYPKKRLLAVFQPHQEDRLKALFDDFAASFDQADIVLLAPVFKATGRESGEGATSDALAESIRVRDAQVNRRRVVQSFASNDELVQWVKSERTAGDCILVMTAGDLYAKLSELKT